MFLKAGMGRRDELTGRAAVSPLSDGTDAKPKGKRFLSIFNAIAKLDHPIRKARAWI
jgi:hypothetical protein